MMEQVYAQAVLLAGLEDPGQEKLLKLLCRSAVNGLRLRPTNISATREQLRQIF